MGKYIKKLKETEVINNKWYNRKKKH